MFVLAGHSKTHKENVFSAIIIASPAQDLKISTASNVRWEKVKILQANIKIQSIALTNALLVHF